MNLFCFSLEGSMDSLYESVKQGSDMQDYNAASRPPSPEVQQDEATGWHSLTRSPSTELYQFHHGSAKKKKKKTFWPKAASDNEAIDDFGHNKIHWPLPRKGEDSFLIRNVESEGMRKDLLQAEPKTREERIYQLTSWNRRSEQLNQHNIQAEYALGTMATSRGIIKMAQNAPRVKKRSQKSPRKSRSFFENNVHACTCKPVNGNLVVSCISKAKRPEKKPCEEAQQQVHGPLAMDFWWHTGAPCNQQCWTNPVEGPLPQGAAYHMCCQLLAEYRVYACNCTRPLNNDWDWMESAKHPPPCIIRSITDLDLYDSSRSTSFGKFEAFKHHPSPVKPEDNGSTVYDGESGNESDHTKSGGLGKKMKVISLTMRRKMGRKYTKASSDQMSEDTERDHEEDVDSHHHSEKGHLKTNSDESLCSGQSSSSGVTSGSEASSNRDSLRLEDDNPYTGNFCGRARVHTDFVPSPYDSDSLKLKVGNIIDIISKPPMGIWTGMLNNKVGNFKFIYVDLIEDKVSEEPKIRPHRRSKRPRPKTLQELLGRLNLQEYTSSLLLNGYQTVEDLKDLKEKHLIELNVVDPEHRQRLLAAAESLQYAENDCHTENEDAPADCQPKPELSEHPRDSGCYVSSECTDNGKEELDSQQES